MTNYVDGSFFKQYDLNFLNNFLADHGQNFSFRWIERDQFKIKTEAIGIILASSGEIMGPVTGKIKTNDIVLLALGDYFLIGNPRILVVLGSNLFSQPEIIKQADFKVLPSTLGGTRKLIKDDKGKFNIDAHLIWVDKNNVKIPHYHTRLFELYLTEKGSGEILLRNAKEQETVAVKLRPGGFVLVAPNTIHKAQGDNLVIMVVGIPAFYNDDSFKIEI